VSQVLRSLKAQGIEVGSPRFVGFGERVTREVNGVAAHYKNYHYIWKRGEGYGGMENWPAVTVAIYERPGSDHDLAIATAGEIMSSLQDAIPKINFGETVCLD